jgi:hypothetical protein
MGERVKICVSKTHPHLMDEWDFERNAVRPENVTYGSNKMVWWICNKCCYNWKSVLSSRTKKRSRGCPACAGKVAVKNNRLSVFLVGDLLKEWLVKENSCIDINNTVIGSNIKAHWQCLVCGYKWSTAIRNRLVYGTGCPLCANRVVDKTNSLYTKFPEIAAQWNFKLNGSLKPTDVPSGSDRKVWWICSECGYEWKAFIYNRTSKHKRGMCPKCALGTVSSISQEWLNSKYVKLGHREHYIKELGFRVDGFDPKTNTVYEFLGDFWHGNPEKFNPEDINPVVKKTFGILFEETIHRLRLLEKAGYKVIYIWENDFKKQE